MWLENYIIRWKFGKYSINPGNVRVLNDLCDAIKAKRGGKLSSGIFLQHDNAPAHTIAQASKLWKKLKS